MYDPTNPDILILTGDLKAALRTTYLHRSELYSLMMEQMAISMARRPVPNEEAARFIQRPEAITSNIIRNLEEAAMYVDFFVMMGKPIFNFVIHVKSYSTSNFCITSALRRLIRTLAGYYEKYSYTYSELYNYICAYITTNNHLIDEQNQNIIKCERDMLGEAFSVNTFHRCQLKTLITTQFIAEVFLSLIHI